jgi:hypothetical protein
LRRAGVRRLSLFGSFARGEAAFRERRRPHRRIRTARSHGSLPPDGARAAHRRNPWPAGGLLPEPIEKRRLKVKVGGWRSRSNSISDPVSTEAARRRGNVLRLVEQSDFFAILSCSKPSEGSKKRTYRPGLRSRYSPSLTVASFDLDHYEFKQST